MTYDPTRLHPAKYHFTLGTRADSSSDTIGNMGPVGRADTANKSTVLDTTSIELCGDNSAASVRADASRDQAHA